MNGTRLRCSCLRDYGLYTLHAGAHILIDQVVRLHAFAQGFSVCGFIEASGARERWVISVAAFR